MNLPDANDHLFGGGKPTAKFNTPGDTYAGAITRPPETSQQSEYGKPQNLLTWPDGRPKLQVIISIATDMRDPQVENDDGVRRVFVKGKRLEQAVRDAVRAAGATGLEVGGHFSITFTGYGQGDNPANPPKEYQVRYTSAANTALGGAPQPAMAGAQAHNGYMTAAQPAPAQAAPQQPAQGVNELEVLLGLLPVDQAAAMRAGGIGADTLKNMNLFTPEQIGAAKAAGVTGFPA